MKNINYKAFNIISLAVVLCVLVLFLLRIVLNTGVHSPMHIITSGYEEESLYAIWKYIHSQPVYFDPHKIPFAASYFNWLFYYFYGSVISLLQSIFHFGDEWIPQVGRYITLSGCIFGAVISFKIVNTIIKGETSKLFTASVIISFFFGYLIGFWAFSVRPDVWATSLELAGLYAFILFVKSNKKPYLLLSAFVFYLSWSFKQNFAGVAIGCFFFLLIRKKYKDAALLAIIPSSLVLAAVLIGSEDYFYLLLKSQLKQQGAAFSVGFYNFKLAFIKSFNITATAILLSVILLIHYKAKELITKVYRNDTALLFLLTGVISFVLFALASAKLGASDNYYFSPFAILMMALIYAFHAGSIHLSRGFFNYAYIFTGLFYIYLGVLIISGKQGIVSQHNVSEKYYSVKEVITRFPKPVFVEGDNNANLPWINPGHPNFVLATTYYVLRNDRDKLEEGGIEGLMEKGYFETIINIDKPDEGYKSLYHLSDTVTKDNLKFYIWRKKQPDTKPKE
ncbi:MAG: hypothetical protein QM725_15565 [Lacibacter sp.]